MQISLSVMKKIYQAFTPIFLYGCSDKSGPGGEAWKNETTAGVHLGNPKGGGGGGGGGQKHIGRRFGGCAYSKLYSILKG